MEGHMDEEQDIIGFAGGMGSAGGLVRFGARDYDPFVGLMRFFLKKVRKIKYFLIFLLLIACGDEKINFPKKVEYDMNERSKVIINDNEGTCSLFLSEDFYVHYDCFNLKLETNDGHDVCKGFLVSGTEIINKIIISFEACFKDNKIVIKNINWSRGYHFLDVKIKGKNNKDDFDYVVQNYIDKIFE
jgi:hypothetical protein